MEEKLSLTVEELKAIVLAVSKDTGRRLFWVGIKIGFLGGLTVGWIAGGLIMLGLGQ